MANAKKEHITEVTVVKSRSALEINDEGGGIGRCPIANID